MLNRFYRKYANDPHFVKSIPTASPKVLNSTCLLSKHYNAKKKFKSFCRRYSPVVLPSQDAPAAISEIFLNLELCIFSESLNYGFF